MDRAQNEFELACLPSASAGSKSGNVRSSIKNKSSMKLRKKSSNAGVKGERPQMTTTGGGYDAKGRTTTSKNTKKIILVSGMLLAVVSSVAIILVMNGKYQPDYMRSIQQFSGALQLEQVDGEYIKWSDDYRDLGSEKTTELTEKLSSKLVESFKEEGIYIDKVVINEIRPTEPKSFGISQPVDKVQFGKHEPESGENEYTYMRSLSPQDFSNIAVENVQYNAVQFISANFTTTAVPAKNTAVFMASNGRWPEVSNVIESRMASKGIGVSIGSVTVKKSFMNSVQKAAEATPSLVNAPPGPGPTARLCDCKIDGTYLFDSEMVCGCKSPCTDTRRALYGGKNNEFGQFTQICYAAYYADIITENGGSVLVMRILEGEIAAGEEKKGIKPYSLFKLPRYRIKGVGSVIRPPPRISSSSKASHSSEALFHMHVLVKSTDDFQSLEYGPEFAGVKKPEAKKLLEKIKPEIMQVLESMGISPIFLFANSVYEYRKKSDGVVIAYEARGEIVQAVLDAENDGPGSLKYRISDQMMHMDIVAFRFSRQCLAKMETLEKKEAS